MLIARRKHLCTISALLKAFLSQDYVQWIYLFTKLDLTCVQIHVNREDMPLVSYLHCLKDLTLYNPLLNKGNTFASMCQQRT